MMQLIMSKSMKKAGLGFLLFTISQTAIAANDENEIVVTAPDSQNRVEAPSTVIDRNTLIARLPTDLSRIFRTLPGTSLRPNSRGESIIRIRGSEERQTLAFLDGMPLAIPWDGRAELQVLPTAWIEQIHIHKNTAPIEFGANAVAGVVELSTKRAERDGLVLEGNALFGTYGTQDLAAIVGKGADRFSITLGGGYSRRSAEPVADTGTLPFNQQSGNRRTNSDFETFSLLGSADIDIGSAVLRATVIHNATKRGVAPEGHLDPAAAAPRYWRYPRRDFTQIGIGLEAPITDDLEARLIGWQQWFDQQIDAYRDASYTTLRSSERNKDLTQGVRATLAFTRPTYALRTSLSYQNSNHDQTDISYPLTSAPVAQPYQQKLFSAGAEFDLQLSDTAALTLGGGYDRSATPKTGNKPRQPNADALIGTGALRWQVNDHLKLTTSIGKRTRFAAMRELYGEALGRFLTNPDLKPESAFLADFAMEWKRDKVNVSITPFYQNSDDTILQRVVAVNGKSLRQRYNARGTISYGVEAEMGWKPSDTLRFDLGASYLNAKTKGAPGAPARRLQQRPDYELFAGIDWTPLPGFDLRSEIHHTGRSVDLNSLGLLQPLSGGTELNLRAAWSIATLKDGSRIRLTGAADNLTDATIFPQLGLPAPGRTFRVGIRLTPAR